MKNLFAQHKNMIIAIAIILVVAIGMYFYMGQSSGSGDAVVTVQAGQADDQFLASLGQLRRLKLDESIFQSPVWQSLVDYSQPLVPETPGRPNPFAPLGQSGQVGAASSTSSTAAR